MKMLASLVAALGLAVMPAMAENVSLESQPEERGATDGPRGFTTDQDPFNNSPSGASFISFRRHNIVAGRGELTPGDVDYWGVSLEAGQTLVVVTTPLGSLPTGFSTPDTVVTIRDSSDLLLVGNDDAGADLPNGAIRGSVVRFRAQTAGNYLIRVDGFFASQTGPYAIHFATVGGNDTDWGETGNDGPAIADFVPINELGPSVGFATTEVPLIDYFRIDLNANDILVAFVNQLGNLPSNWSSPNLNMTIYGADGVTALLASSDDNGEFLPAGGSSSGVTLRFRAPTAGSYFVLVGDDDLSATFYTLALARIPASFCPGDADGSGTVNFLDITTILANFGNSCP